MDPVNDSSIFYCDSCLPTPEADETLTPILPNPDNSSFHTSDLEFSDAHSSDFDWESESDDELRGQNFASLPAQSVSSFNTRVEKSHLPRIGLRTINYKYPCNVCHGPCKENVHDSIQCTWCDEWIHQKCSNLSYEEFAKHCSPENIDLPYHCEI